MRGLDLHQPEQLQERNQVFVDVYEHDSDIDQLDDLASGLKSRVLINGWDKLIASPKGNRLYNLQTDSDDRNNLAEKHPEKVKRLSQEIKNILP